MQRLIASALALLALLAVLVLDGYGDALALAATLALLAAYFLRLLPRSALHAAQPSVLASGRSLPGAGASLRPPS